MADDQPTIVGTVEWPELTWAQVINVLRYLSATGSPAFMNVAIRLADAGRASGTFHVAARGITLADAQALHDLLRGQASGG